MYNIHSDAIRSQMHDFLYDGNSNVFSISRHLRDIRKSNKCQKFNLENEGQGQGGETRNWRHSTGIVQFHIDAF